MTQLRKKMLEELQRRNYSKATARVYIRAVRQFAEFFHCSPEKLGPEHIRQYQLHLLTKKKLAPTSVAQQAAALRFLYVKNLAPPLPARAHPLPQTSPETSTRAQSR